MNLQMVKLVNLEGLHEKIKDQKLSIKVAYKLSKLFSVVEKETNFYREKLQEIIDKYAEKDEFGNPIPANDGAGVKIQKDQITVCQSELDELFNLEVELPDVTFDLDELNSLELSIDDFTSLLPFIND